MFPLDQQWTVPEREPWSDGGWRTEIPAAALGAPILANLLLDTYQAPWEIRDFEGGFFSRTYLIISPTGAELVLSTADAAISQRQAADSPGYELNRWEGLEPFGGDSTIIPGGLSRNYPSGNKD